LQLQTKQQSFAPLQPESLVTVPDTTEVAAHKLAEVFKGEVVEDFASVEPSLPQPEQLASIPSATESEYSEPTKPLVTQEIQLQQFSVG
jgi:hypothetical protein